MSPIYFLTLPVMQKDGMLVWKRELKVGFRLWLIIFLYRRMNWKQKAEVEIWMSHYAVVDHGP